MINKSTQDEQKIGYSACKECTSGIHLNEAGFEVETHLCAQCKCYVADADEFFNVSGILSGR